VLALAPARPNPFPAATTLRFTLAHAGRARLEVLDVSGQRVALLFDGTASAGEHAVRWDGRDANGLPRPAGMYFGQLSADGQRIGTKLLLVR
jgi:flagellar hook assembly protein FlgD